jgi:hypothetical protein
MNNWFTVKLKYNKELENGSFKRVSEPYLLAAMSFTDAETRIFSELGDLIRGEFTVSNIARTEFHDIFHYEDSDTWYKCRISFQSETDESEKAKKVSQNFLVSANSVKEAYERIQESLSGMMVDYDILSIILSPIVEIFPYVEELDKEISRVPITKMEDSPSSKTPIYSASGSDIDDEEDFTNEEESELEDEYSEEN